MNIYERISKTIWIKWIIWIILIIFKYQIKIWDASNSYSYSYIYD